MGKKPCGCETLANDVEYVNPVCPVHGPPCGCKGCWACAGNTPGCTCDVDWDEVYGH